MKDNNIYFLMCQHKEVCWLFFFYSYGNSSLNTFSKISEMQQFQHCKYSNVSRFFKKPNILNQSETVTSRKENFIC